MIYLTHAAQNPFALLRVLRQNLRAFSVERIDDMGETQVCRFLNFGTIKIAMLEKKTQTLLEYRGRFLV